MSFIVIIILILAILLVIFTLQNSTAIDLNIFFWEISEVPLVIVLLICVLCGYLIATFHLYPKLLKTRNKLHKLERQQRAVKPRIQEPEVDDEGVPLVD